MTASARAMRRLLRAEIRKLRRPLTTSLFLAATTFCVLYAGIAQFNGQQAANALAGSTAMRCAVGQPWQTSPPCDSGGRDARASEALRPVAVQAVQDLRSASVLQQPPGGPLLAGGMWATLVGGCTLALLTAGHVAGEWSGRTIATVLGSSPSRVHFLVTKMVSLWLVAVSMLVANALIFAGLGLISALASPLRPQIAPDVGMAAAMLVLGRAAVVMMVFVTLGSLAAVATRNPLGAFVLTMSMILGAFGLTPFLRAPHFSPALWVNGWMGLRPDGQIPHLWIDTTSPPHPLTSLAGLIGIVLVAVLASWRLVTRMDVTV
jgi:ABC-type transport system involved in multi-copper enzyme maturation permease subunit